MEKEPDKITRDFINRAETEFGNKTAGITRTNYDPLSKDTYRRIFERDIKNGDIIINLGAGSALDVTGILNHLNSELSESAKKKKADVIPIDFDFRRSKTFNLLKDAKEGEDHVHPITSDVTRLPFKDSSIDGVVSSNLINCPPEDISLYNQANKIISEAWRVLKPGGFILLSSFGYIFSGEYATGTKLYNDEITKHTALTLKEIEKILLNKGFADIRELQEDDEHRREVEKHRFYLDEEALEVGGFLAFKPK